MVFSVVGTSGHSKLAPYQVSMMTMMKDTATFQVLFIVSLFCAWNITTAEINTGDYLIREVPLFTSGGLGLGLVSSGVGLGLAILVLVLRIWSCIHHC